jgi:hypothetical protein
MNTCVGKGHSRGLLGIECEGLGKIEVATSPLIRKTRIIRHTLQRRDIYVSVYALKVLVFLAGDFLNRVVFLSALRLNEQNVVIVSINMELSDNGAMHFIQYFLDFGGVSSWRERNYHRVVNQDWLRSGCCRNKATVGWLCICKQQSGGIHKEGYQCNSHDPRNYTSISWSHRFSPSSNGQPPTDCSSRACLFR